MLKFLMVALLIVQLVISFPIDETFSIKQETATESSITETPDNDGSTTEPERKFIPFPISLIKVPKVCEEGYFLTNRNQCRRKVVD